jgi:hypothetical protein
MDSPGTTGGISGGLIGEFEDDLKWARYLIGAAVCAEIGFWVAFLVLIDFGDRFHWLLLMMAAAIYAPLACWLVALLFLTRLWTLRILRAIERLGEPVEPECPA